ncbi:hypothetical protein DCAR_0832916 [Daucus carota subsp. sativus]|uniref:Uncharacterized protein n=1 Tax=Daucus carota subsp. sativus TaxID=79200 RepID=A0A175YRA2_DAUCS|nr:hypothetical protein DCAR_0832916 [Daucus carota subsp. sativus]
MEISGGGKLISADSQTIIHEDSVSPSSASATTSTCPPHDYEGLDTSLKLGLNY